jgi:hypothetical protein
MNRRAARLPFVKEVTTAVVGRTNFSVPGASASASGPLAKLKQTLGAGHCAKNSLPWRPDELKGACMKKMSWLLVLAIFGTVASLSLAGASACPPSSKNPAGKPPNCGHPAPSPTPTPTQTPPGGGTTCSTGGLGGSGTILNSDKNEDGQVSGPIHTQLEPQVDGLAPVVHEVNCDVVVSLGL